MQSVAIIGAGPGGLVAARFLRHAGFATTLLDAADAVGGHWNVGAPTSAAWPALRTNTSRLTTAFSDLAWPAHVAVYPSAEQVGAYLHEYARRFALLDGVRLGTSVSLVARDARTGRWRVRSRERDGATREEEFSHVVVATGSCRRPVVPAIEGLSAFAGSAGVSHAMSYRGARPFDGLRVLVVGGSISALEVASELATGGAARVVVASRRQRWVFPRFIGGAPTDQALFTRAAALAEEAFPPQAAASALRDLVLRAAGRPEQYGAPATDDDILAAGITLSHGYLPLVADGRIAPRPMLARVDGARATFADGSSEAFDAIVLGTGYLPDLSYLSTEVRTQLGTRGPAAHGHLPDLHGLTFHPDLPGLAFLGMYEQVGPRFPTLELQARWVAGVWGGTMPAPTRAELLDGVARARAMRVMMGGGHEGAPLVATTHGAARQLARLAGLEPSPADFPALVRALHFGPLTAVSYRLSGPDALPDAPARVLADAAAFGGGHDGPLTPEQAAQLRVIAAARGDHALEALVRQLLAPAADAPTLELPGSWRRSGDRPARLGA